MINFKNIFSCTFLYTLELREWYPGILKNADTDHFSFNKFE